MQIFIPYKDPIEVARCLDLRRLRKQIIECNQILKAISGESKAWSNHPVVKMYYSYSGWIYNYKNCLESYLIGNLEESEHFNNLCMISYPWFLDYQDLIIQHRKRLYTKNQSYYSSFSIYGCSEENWYIVDEELLIYVSGKLIKKVKWQSI